MKRKHQQKMPYSTRSTTSVYSHVSTGPTRSYRSIEPPWYSKPLLRSIKNVPIQNGSMFTGMYSLGVAIFTIITAAFDVYCLAMAAPGSTHYGYYFISYEFVYVGNKHVRNALMIIALFSLIGGLAVFVTGIMLLIALRREYEKKMLPWMWTFLIFTAFRMLAFIFFAIVNDLMFGYNIFIVIMWILITIISTFGWLIIHTCYLEFANITRLEDLAQMRIGTMASLQASKTNSIGGSRPTTPHSTISTMPVDDLSSTIRTSVSQYNNELRNTGTETNIF